MGKTYTFSKGILFEYQAGRGSVRFDEITNDDRAAKKMVIRTNHYGNMHKTVFELNNQAISDMISILKELQSRHSNDYPQKSRYAGILTENDDDKSLGGK